MKPKVVIYSKVPCPYCVRAKEFFTQRNIPFQEIDLTGQYEEMDQLKARTGHMTFPQIYVNEEFIGGYSDLLEKIEAGDLKI